MFLLLTESYRSETHPSTIGGLSIPKVFYAEHLSKVYNAIFTLLTRFYEDCVYVESVADIDGPKDFVVWLNGREENLDAQDALVVEDCVRVYAYDEEKAVHELVLQMRVERAEPISLFVELVK